jgi:hypothetical protein
MSDLVIARPRRRRFIAQLFIATGPALALWVLLDPRMNNGWTVRIALSVFLLVASVILLLAYLDSVSLRITSRYIEGRSWGRRVRLKWNEIEQTFWRRNILILRGSLSVLALKPNNFVNCAEIVGAIEQAVRGTSTDGESGGSE